MTKKQVVLVGDAFCGKTALATRLSIDLFCDGYCPTDFDDYSVEIYTKLGSCNLTVLDTAGCHEETNIRALSYKGCDAVIVCFDLTDASTLQSIESHWLPELKKHCPNVPFYIAGCKRDAMCEGADGCVCGGNCCTLTEGELMNLIERTGAYAYTECSARTSENVEDLFQMVVETASPKRKNSAKKIVASIKKKSKLLKRLSVFA